MAILWLYLPQFPHGNLFKLKGLLQLENNLIKLIFHGNIAIIININKIESTYKIKVAAPIYNFGLFWVFYWQFFWFTKIILMKSNPQNQKHETIRIRNHPNFVSAFLLCIMFGDYFCVCVHSDLQFLDKFQETKLSGNPHHSSPGHWREVFTEIA